MPKRRIRAASALTLITLLPALAWAEPDPGYRFTIDWTTTNAESWLSYLGPLAGRAETSGLEIGCFEGQSTLWFLANVATHEEARMTCVDVFTDEIEANFDHNVKLSGQGARLIKKKGYSQDVLRKLPYDGYDFVYIDGCHLASCVMTDAVLSWDLLRGGGYLIFDDYGLKLHKPPSERPQVAIDAFIEAFGDQVIVREIGTQVVLQKREGLSDTERIGEPVVHDLQWLRNLRALSEANRRKREAQHSSEDEGPSAN